jgi:CheY-like chemotaxis protein/HPt (histidine-containing phosphotransfer) domain-containing protein
MMGGKIHVESMQGSGSTFYFTIQTSKAKAPETAGQQKQGASMLINSRVLIISDKAAEAGNFSSYFHKWGMHPQVTDSFSEALNWLRNNEHFDLIAIDAKIAQISFMELVARIRTLFSPSQLPIIIFNASGDDIYFNYSDKTISAIIPQNIDRSRLLDILISIFTIEEHSRSKNQFDLRQSDKELASKIPLNILIAEDNKINQKLAVNIIETLGYHPDTVENGLEVISSVQKKKYDMIFMDIQMPELDGFETTRHLHRTFEPSQRPVIIAMTAFAMEGDKEKCIEAGMDDYISKPIIIEEIVNVITRYGGNRKSVQTQRPVETKREEENEVINRGVIQRLKELNEKVDPEFFKVVINMFLNQSPNLIDEIKHYMQSGQYDKMGQAAHKLKGSSMNLGAGSLAELCKKIEIKARTNELSDIDRLIESLQPVYEKTEMELKKLY